MIIEAEEYDFRIPGYYYLLRTQSISLQKSGLRRKYSLSLSRIESVSNTFAEEIIAKNGYQDGEAGES
jgi:hypothetical protein